MTLIPTATAYAQFALSAQLTIREPHLHTRIHFWELMENNLKDSINPFQNHIHSSPINFELLSYNSTLRPLYAAQFLRWECLYKSAHLIWNVYPMRSAGRLPVCVSKAFYVLNYHKDFSSFLGNGPNCLNFPSQLSVSCACPCDSSGGVHGSKH